jgi:hypothetical protein
LNYLWKLVQIYICHEQDPIAFRVFIHPQGGIAKRISAVLNTETLVRKPFMNENISKILEAFPFLSYGLFDEREYIGIIQNSDNSLLSMYILDMIPDEALRLQFLKYGEEWWWGSNRQIPINIFFKEQFLGFRPYLRHFSRKDFNLVQGHAVSLQETISRRIRKRQITLIRRLPADK